jgi:hypothetical protein
MIFKCQAKLIIHQYIVEYVQRSGFMKCKFLFIISMQYVSTIVADLLETIDFSLRKLFILTEEIVIVGIL